MADTISKRVSTQDVKRIQADALEAEAKHLRRMVKRNKNNKAMQDAANLILTYFDQRALVLRVEADSLDHL